MTQVRKILIADDDEDLRGELVEQLAMHAEFQPFHAPTATA
ncbi:MAG TPA: DNA-binding response regulator, partial [Methylovirgula sp.]|nr:DNA-binding response regulator [Methylovirgula sp.]